MKGYRKPEEIVKGKCFICNEVCNENSYCHMVCAVAYGEEKDKRIEEAKRKVKEEENAI